MANTVDLGSVYATLDLKTKNFESGIQSANSAMGGFKQTALGVFAGNLITQGVNAMSSAIVNFGKDALEGAGNMEQWRTSFEVMLGSADKAKTLLTQISDFAIKTPFELPQVVQGAKSLLAYGISAEKLLPTFASLGNIAAGVGRDKLPQLILAFGQVKAATKLTGAELRQFTEAGVPLLEVLAKQSGKTAAQVKQDMEDGLTISFEEVEKALGSMSQQGGKFFNLMEKQSFTFGGVMSNMKDSVTRFSLALMGVTVAGDVVEGGLFDRIRKSATAFQKFLSDNSAKINKVLSAIGEGLTIPFQLFDKFTKFIGANSAGLVATIAILTLAFGALGAAIWAAIAPVLLPAIAAVGAFVASAAPVIAVVVAIAIALDALVNKFTSWGKVFEVVKTGISGVVDAFKLLITGDFTGKGLFGLQEDSSVVNALFVIRETIMGIVDAFKLLISGDFTGKGLFGLSEDSALVNGLLTIRETITGIYDAFKLLVTGDFTGKGLFGLTEDSPVVNGILTIREALEWLGGFIKDQLLSIFDSLKEAFGKLVQEMAPVVDMFKSFWKDHGDKVLTVLKYLGIALGIVSGLLIAAPIVVFVGALKLLAVVIGFIADHFNGLIQILKLTVGIAIAPFVVAVWLIINAFKLVVTIVQTVWTVISTVFNAIVAVIVPIVTFIKDIIVGYFTIWWNVVSGILGFLKDLFVVIFGSILLVVLTVVGFIKDTIVTVFTAIWDFLSPILATLWGYVTTGFNAMKDIIVGAVKAIWDFISLAWNTIYGIISGIVQRIINFFAPAFNWLLDKGKDIVRGLASGISAVASLVWNAIKSVADQIGNFFSGAGQWLYDVGRNIVQGLINGIKSMVDGVKNAAGSVGDAVKDKLKSVLGIGSPSKITAKYGVWVGEGFVNGIEDMQNKITQAVQDTFGLSDVAGSVGSSFAGANNALRTATSSAIPTNNSNSVSIYGDISIGDQKDADYLLSRLSRRQDLTAQGLVGM